jgi:hypothetical protein
MRRSKTSVLLGTLVASLVAIAASCSKPPAESGRSVEAQSQGAGELVPQAVASEEPDETSEDAQVAAGDTALTAPEPADATAPVEPTPPAEPAASGEADETAAPLDTAEDANMAVDAADQPARTPDIHFVPTPQDVVNRMLELAQVTKDDLVYDLGCGDGRIVVTAAKTYGCKAVGFDIDPQRVKESLDRVRENQVEALVTIRNADIFELDLTPASVVSLYLLPQLNVRLIPQLKELKPGSRIVSHDFDMRGVEPDKVEEVTTEDGISHKIYLWTTPLKIDQAAVDEARELFE